MKLFLALLLTATIGLLLTTSTLAWTPSFFPPNHDLTNPEQAQSDRLDLFFSTLASLPLNTTEINSTLRHYFATAQTPDASTSSVSSVSTNNTTSTTSTAQVDPQSDQPVDFYGFTLPPLTPFDFQLDHFGLSLNDFNVTMVSVANIERTHTTTFPPEPKHHLIDLEPSPNAFITPQNRFELKITNITVQAHSNWLIYIHQFPIVQDCGHLDVALSEIDLHLAIQQVNITDFSPHLTTQHFHSVELYDRAVQIYQTSRSRPLTRTPSRPSRNTTRAETYIPPFRGLYIALNRTGDYLPIQYPGLTRDGLELYHHMVNHEVPVEFINHATNQTERLWIQDYHSSLVVVENQRFMVNATVSIQSSSIKLSWTLLASVYNFFLHQFANPIRKAIAVSMATQVTTLVENHFRSGYYRFQAVQRKLSASISDSLSDHLSAFLNPTNIPDSPSQPDFSRFNHHGWSNNRNNHHRGDHWNSPALLAPPHDLWR